MRVFFVTLFLFVACSQSRAWSPYKRLRPPPPEILEPEKPLCAPPKCPPGCKIETDFKGPCPGCDCGPKDDEIGVKKPDFIKSLCDPVKCDRNCREAIAPNGCPTCLCGPLCSPPKCGPGCEIEVDFEGPCPGCKCGKGGGKALCDPVKCEPGCREVITPEGCPTCLCGPICDIPRCPPDCEIETVFDGPCPGCKCGKKPDLIKASCDPVKCEGNCREALAPNGCPTCLCGPLCSPPKCDPGCEIEVDFKGPCPGCKCGGIGKDLFKASCDPVKCEGNCREALAPNGCPTCICDPLCSPPKCDPGCEIEVDFKGPCPGCKCDKGGIVRPDIYCSPPKCDPGCEIEVDFEGPCPGCKCEKKGTKCPPMEECWKPGCEKKLDDFGCEVCICGPICAIPKCGFGCRLKQGNPPASCPTCVCSRPWSKGRWY